MKRALLIGMVLLAGWLGRPSAEEPVLKQTSTRSKSMPTMGSTVGRLPLPIGLDLLPATLRETLNKVMQAPTLTAVSPADEFTSSSETYLWMLDHPDRVSLAWQRLKVAAIDITALSDCKYCYKDKQGSELTWQTVAQNGEGRIWYAEGSVRPGLLLPVVPVKAVAVLRHGVKKNEDGELVIRHQVEVFLQTDSKVATVLMRMLGPAAPQLAEDGAEQMLLFFSGIARYVERHPSKLKTLLAEKK